MPCWEDVRVEFSLVPARQHRDATVPDGKHGSGKPTPRTRYLSTTSTRLVSCTGRRCAAQRRQYQGRTPYIRVPVSMVVLGDHQSFTEMNLTSRW